MFIAVRLAFVFMAFALRLVSPALLDVSKQSVNGIPYYSRVRRKKGGRVYKFKVGLRFKSPVIFKLTRETAVDRFFVKCDLSTEIQSGDHNFDQSFYIACDHPYFSRFVRQSEEVRSYLLRLFHNLDVQQVYYDSRILWLHIKDDREPDDRDRENLLGLYKLLHPLTTGFPKHVQDAYFWKALVIESIVWSVAAYAIGGYFAFAAPQTLYLNMSPLINTGLLFGLTMMAAFFVGIILLMRGSSRGHRILVESIIVLLLTFPPAGIAIVSDINIAMDQGERQLVKRQIVHKEHKVHKRKRSTSHTYHLQLANTAREDSVPTQSQITVSKAFFESAAIGTTLTLEVAPGRLGLPWYAGITQ